MIEELIRYGIKREHGRCIESQLRNITFPSGELVIPNSTKNGFYYLDTVTGYGCDIAQVRKWLDEKSINGEVFGIDLNYGKEYSYEEARVVVERSLGDGGLLDRCKVSQGNALELPFQDDYFHRVSSIALIHHFNRQERKKHFQEAYRVLKSKGILFGWTLSGEDIEDFTKLKYNSLIRAGKRDHEEGLQRVILSYLDNSFSGIEEIVGRIREQNKQFYETVKKLFQQENVGLTRAELDLALVSLVNADTMSFMGYSERIRSSLIKEREAYYRRIKESLGRTHVNEREMGRDVVLHFGEFYRKVNKLMTGLIEKRRGKFSELDEKRIRDSILSEKLFFIDDLTKETVSGDLEQTGFREFSVCSFVAPGYNVMRSLTFYARK